MTTHGFQPKHETRLRERIAWLKTRIDDRIEKRLDTGRDAAEASALEAALGEIHALRQKVAPRQRQGYFVEIAGLAFGFEVEEGTVVSAADCARYCLGWDEAKALKYFSGRGKVFAV